MKKLGQKSTCSLIITLCISSGGAYNLEQREQVNVVSIPPLSAHVQSKLFAPVPASLYPSASEGSILHMCTTSEDEQESVAVSVLP